MLRKKPGHHVVVEVGEVAHHPECSELKLSNGNLKVLEPQEEAREHVRIVRSGRGAEPLTVTTVSPEGLKALWRRLRVEVGNVIPGADVEV